MWVLRVIFLMVGFSSMLNLIGCQGVQKKEDMGFDELVNIEVEKQEETEKGFMGVNDFVQGREIVQEAVVPGSTVDVQVEGGFELFEILKMLLVQFGYSLTCASEGKIMISVSGLYTEEEIITISKGVCMSLGFSLNIDGKICNVVRVDNSRSVSDYVIALRTKHIILQKDFLSDIQSGSEVKVLVFKNIVVMYGLKQQVLMVLEAVKLMDVDYLKGCFVKFINCFDADKVISSLSSMYEIEGVKVVKFSNDMVVVVTVSKDYLDYVSKMVKTLSAYCTLSEVYVYKSRYRGVEEIKDFINTIEKVEMKVDKELSAIFLKCSYEKFVMLKKYLVSFDVLSKQVLMRLYMVDVRSSKDLGLGTDWLADSGSFKINKTGFGSALTGGIGSAYQIGNVKAFFKLLEKVLDAKVISKPSVFVKSGQEAEIKFTRSVPVLTSKGSGQSVGVGTGIIQNIEYKDVGVIFKITPVCVGSNILIEVYIENSSLQKDTGVENNPMFLKDSVSTNFTVRDGSFCVLGGIRYDNNEVSVNGIPFLSRIKFLGYLFGGFKKSYEKREMLVCLFPKVVRNEYESDRLAESLLDGMKFNQN
ncbi:MAG: hypothetical protein AABZ54_08640 [Bacteroidota bacterium]